MDKAESVLLRTGLKYGVIHRWFYPYPSGAYETFYAQVEMHGIKVWCYILIWGSHEPDLYLCMEPEHLSARVYTPRDTLKKKCFWYWENIEEGEIFNTDEESIYMLALRSLCQ